MSEETEGWCQNCGHEFDADAYTECPKCGWPDNHVEFEPEEGEPDYVGPEPTAPEPSMPTIDPTKGMTHGNPLPWSDFGMSGDEQLLTLKEISGWQGFATWLHQAVSRRFVNMLLTRETMEFVRAYVDTACREARIRFDLARDELRFDVIEDPEIPGGITLVPVDSYAKQSTAVMLNRAEAKRAAENHAQQTVVDVAQAMVEPARPRVEWHEDDGDVMWWKFPVVEAPYVGSPLADDFPDYVTHFTKIPVPRLYSNGEQFKLTFKLEVTLGVPELYPDGDQPSPLTAKEVMRLINLEGGPGKVLTSWDLLGCNEKAVTVKVTALDKQLKSIDHPSERKKEGPTR